MSDSLQLRIKNAEQEISRANDAVSQWLAEQDAPPAAEYLANLAIEELVTNCIKYGYDDHHEHFIDISLRFAEAQLEFQIIDDCHPFDPLQLSEPDTSLPVEERPIGGLGIHLLKKMSDSMEYFRENSRNRLVLKKHFHRP